MFRSILIGLVAGQRAMTPLALVAGAARRGVLPRGAFARDLLANPLVASGAVALAAAEMAGDKMASAPDRTILPGIIARSLTAAFAGAVLVPRGHRPAGAALATIAAVASAHVGLALRLRAMRRHSQVSTGIVEDAVVLGSGYAVAIAR